MAAAAKAITEGGFVYRSVTPSKRNSGSRKALYRVEGLLIGIAVFLAQFRAGVSMVRFFNSIPDKIDLREPRVEQNPRSPRAGLFLVSFRHS